MLTAAALAFAIPIHHISRMTRESAISPSTEMVTQFGPVGSGGLGTGPLLPSPSPWPSPFRWSPPPSRSPGPTPTPNIDFVIPSDPAPRDPRLPNPFDPLDPLKKPAPPGVATTTGSNVVVSSTTTGGKARAIQPQQGVLQEYNSESHRQFRETCDPAAKAIAKFRARYPRRIPKSKFQEFVNLANDYDAKCLKSVKVLQNSLSEAVKTDLERRIGVLFYLDNPVCNAVRISDRTILTALHCLYDSATLKLRRSIKQRMKFAAYTRESRRVRISGVKLSPYYSNTKHRRFDILKDQHDYVQLTLASSPDDSALAALKMRPPRIYDRILLVAYHSNLVRADRFARQLGIQTVFQNWRERFRVDNSATCRVNRILKGCIAHACQTEFGTSGAPLLFITEEGQFELLAIHTRGTTSGDPGSCRHDLMFAFPNLGVFPEFE